MSQRHLAILGAGPTGLEAALAAAEKGLDFTLYEAAPAVAGHIAEWAHVRMFTPWDLNVSPRARRALEAAGREVPWGPKCPTGGELRERLLEPLAALPQIAPHLRLGTRVQAVGRDWLLKHEEIANATRAAQPFRLLLADATGERVETAQLVIDCTGSYAVPNALGNGGIPAPGEQGLGARIRHRIPDFARERPDWAGKTVFLTGAGHSAETAVVALAELAEDAPGTRVIWSVRAPALHWGALEDDPLPARAALAGRARALAAGASPAVESRFGSVVDAVAAEGEQVRIELRHRDGRQSSVLVDHVLALTGAVGEHLMYRQLQVHECYATSGPMKLSAALLGAGAADCMAQSSHGAETLKNPEPGFFLLGSKSYGRNNTFLLRLAWEQVDEVMSLL